MGNGPVSQQGSRTCRGPSSMGVGGGTDKGNEGEGKGTGRGGRKGVAAVTLSR